jgi:hypothetical protein
LASLFQFPLEGVEVASVAAKLRGCGDSLLGVSFGAVDQFNACEGLGGCHNFKPQFIFSPTLPRTLRSIDLSKGMKNPACAACCQLIVTFWDFLPFDSSSWDFLTLTVPNYWVFDAGKH